MLHFETDNVNDGGKELSSPLTMMTQTPIIVSMALLCLQKGRGVSKQFTINSYRVM